MGGEAWRGLPRVGSPAEPALRRRRGIPREQVGGDRHSATPVNGRQLTRSCRSSAPSKASVSTRNQRPESSVRDTTLPREHSIAVALWHQGGGGTPPCTIERRGPCFGCFRHPGRKVGGLAGRESAPSAQEPPALTALAVTAVTRAGSHPPHPGGQCVTQQVPGA